MIRRLVNAAFSRSTFNFLRKVYRRRRKDIPNNKVVSLRILNENPNKEVNNAPDKV